MSPTRSCSSSSSSATAAAACCRSAIRRCSSAICRASPSCGRLNLWPEWLFVNGSLLAIYWLIDQYYHHPRETVRDIERDVDPDPPASRFSGLGSQRAAAARRRPGGGAARPEQSRSRHGLASLDVLPRGRAAGARRPFARCSGREQAAHDEQLQLRRDHRSGRPVRRHLHLHAARAADSQSQRRRPGRAVRHARASSSGRPGRLSSFLDNAPTYLVFFQTAQRSRAGRADRPAGVPEDIADRHQPRRRVHGRDDLHRQRPQFHGQGDRREVGRQDAELLRLHGLQLADPAADPRA